MSGPRVLLTNLSLSTRTGTELYVRDVAVGLRRRGLETAVYSPDCGAVAGEIRAAGVPVVDDIADLAAKPDVLHGHHHLETMTALLNLPGVPAVYFSHDAAASHDAAPLFPRILRYVAVDEANRERLAAEGVPPERLRVVLNFVDLTRFRPRGPLPPRPRRALVFSNNASDGTFLQPVRAACTRVGLPLDVAGSGVGRPLERPEDALGRYDLVFAKARCALEAMAVGAAVVLCDVAGRGPMVTAAELDRLRADNFGRRALTSPATADGLALEIGRYDAGDAGEVSRRIREAAGLEPALDRLIGVYEEAVAEARATREWDRAGEDRAAAVYLARWGSRLGYRDELARTRSQLDAVRSSATWQARERLLRVAGLRRLYRAFARAAPPREE